MEQWEIDLRARLNEEIKDGAYQISGGKLVVWTGKLGYINYLVEIEREIKSFVNGIKEILDDERKKT